MFENAAEEYAKCNARQYIHNDGIGFCTSEEEVEEAFQKAAEFGYNKAKEELTAQIEKMKCCENCKHHCFWGNELNCSTLSYDEELDCMKTKNRWELLEASE